MPEEFLEYYRSSGKAEKKLSETLGLIWDTSMQDWDLINSDPDRITDFLKAYNKLDDSDEKFILMQLIVASFDDYQSEQNFNTKLWDKCSIVLEKEHPIHIHTICYWSTKADESDHFFISPFMDEIFKKVIRNYR